MKGKDSNNWIKLNGIWNKIKEYKLDKIIKILYKKMYKWFKKNKMKDFM
jgi:hypothetical protein